MVKDVSRVTRPASELWAIYEEFDDECVVFIDQDTSWRHGWCETIVIQDGDRFWKGMYAVSNDHEINGFRDGDLKEFYEVFPKVVSKTIYE